MSTPLRPPAPDRPFGTPSSGGLGDAQPQRTGRTGLVPGVISVLIYVFAVVPLLSTVALPIGLLMSVVAIVLAVRALRRPGPRTRPMIGLVTGLIGFVFSGIVIGVAVWMWPQISTYTQCQGAANTVEDRTACSTRFTSDVASKIERSLGLEPGSITLDQP